MKILHPVVLAATITLLTACAVKPSTEHYSTPATPGRTVISVPQSSPVNNPAPASSTGSQTAAKMLSPITSN